MKINWHNILNGDFSPKRIIRSFLIFYILIVIIGLFFSEKLIFPAPQSSYDENITNLKFINSSDGTKLATRFWKSNSEKHVILYFHGNAEDIGQIDGFAKSLNHLGYSFLALDYRGYGLSEGKISEQNCYSDALAVYQSTIEMGYDPNQIIIWGRSVGSGSAVDLASKVKSKALILESPFSTAFTVMTKIPIVPFDKFNNLNKIDEVQAPMFILHGGNDKVISPWHSEKLFNKHLGPKKRYAIKEAGHNNIWSYQIHDTLNKIDRFINEHR